MLQYSRTKSLLNYLNRITCINVFDSLGVVQQTHLNQYLPSKRKQKNMSFDSDYCMVYYTII